MAVDSGYAAWLKSEELVETVSSSDAALWGTAGVTVALSSPFATESGAAAEAARALAMLGGPLVRDKATVTGHRSDLVGRCIVGRSDKLDYSLAGQRVFVLGAVEQADNTTVLTVLKRLR